MTNLLLNIQHKTKPLQKEGQKQQFFIVILLLFLTITLILNQHGASALSHAEPSTAYFPQLLGHHPGEQGTSLYIYDDYLYAGYGNELVIFAANTVPNPEPVISLFFHGTIKKITIVDTRAYILTSNGIHILDITNPETAVKLGYLALDIDDYSPSIEIANQTAYILSLNGGSLHIMYIIDVSDPVTLTQIRSYETTSSSILGIQGQVIFLEDWDNGSIVHALSLVDPIHPQLISSYTVNTTNINSAHLINGYLYLLTENMICGAFACDYDYYLRILAADTLTELASYNVPDSSQMQIINDHIYFFGFPDLLHIWALSTPLTAHEVGSYSTEGSLLSVVIDTQNIYAFTKYFGLQRINITNPTTPQPAGDYQPFNFKDIALGNDMVTLFTLDTNEQFRILDLTNPQQPIQLYSQQLSRTTTFTLMNELIYILWLDKSPDDWSFNYMLDIIDVTVPVNPILISRYSLQYPGTVPYDGEPLAQLQVIENKVHIVIEDYDYSTYTIIDIANPAMPQQQGFLMDSDLRKNFVILENYAILRVKDGLQLLDITDPAQFIDLGKQLTDRRFTAGPVKYQGFIYFGERRYGGITHPQLSTFDASNPTNLIEIHQQGIEGVPYEMWVMEDQLHVGTSSVSYPFQKYDGFYLYTLNDPAALDYAAWLSANSGLYPKSIDRSGNTIFVSNPYYGLDIVHLLPTVSELYFPIIMKRSVAQ